MFILWNFNGKLLNFYKGNLLRLSLHITVLLDLTKIFNESEGRYIFNQLYIDQYVAWVQKLKKDNLEKIAAKIEDILNGITKEDLDLELKELEAAAEMVLKESQNDEEILIKSMKNVEISDTKKDRLASENDSDDESNSDSEDSDSDSSDSNSSDSDDSTTEEEDET